MKFTDNRGTLLFPIKQTTNPCFIPKECTVSVNKLNVFRGIHVNTFDKLVTCIRGKVLDIIINFNECESDYMQTKYYTLDPETDLFQILVPKNHGHGFLSLVEDSMLLYHFADNFSDADTKHVHYASPSIDIKLPITPILSEKDNILHHYVQQKTTIGYIVIGSSGFMGSNVVKHLYPGSYMPTDLRLQDIEGIGRLLDRYKPKYVICCAGITGQPNIFWCDDHKTETIENNITYQLTLAKLCKDRQIHLTVFGSGAIFDNERTYTESDTGNFYRNFYSSCRIYLENIIKHYDNVLYLRINYPIAQTASNKNLITKLLTYKNVDAIDLSITYIDNLIPILLRMIQNNEHGVCNFTNPGIISLDTILKTYNRLAAHKHEYNVVEVAGRLTTCSVSEGTNMMRSVPKLASGKLNAYGPLYIDDAVSECLGVYCLSL